MPCLGNVQLERIYFCFLFENVYFIVYIVRIMRVFTLFDLFQYQNVPNAISKVF